MPRALWDDPDPLVIIGGNSRISFDGRPPEVSGVNIQERAFHSMLRLYRQRTEQGLLTRMWVCIDHNTPSPRKTLLKPGTTARNQRRPTLEHLRDELRAPLQIPADFHSIAPGDVRVMFEAHLRSSVRHQLHSLPKTGMLRRQIFEVDAETGLERVRCRAIFAEAMRRALDIQEDMARHQLGFKNLIMYLENAPWTFQGNVNAAGVITRELG